MSDSADPSEFCLTAEVLWIWMKPTVYTLPTYHFVHGFYIKKVTLSLLSLTHSVSCLSQQQL